MKRVVLLALLAFACSPREDALLVDAAASLTDVLAEAGKAWTAKSARPVRFNFAGSGTLARQIESGAPGDVFISADETQMDRVALQSLIVPSTRRDVLSNALVVVVPAAGTPVRNVNGLASKHIRRIALGDPQLVPAGAYARAFLLRAGVWDAIAPKVVPTENVRAALSAVASGNADAAIVYRTDVSNRSGVSIAFEVPPALAPSIRYPAAVLRSSRDPRRAADFVAFLSTSQCTAIFRKYGFEVR